MRYFVDIKDTSYATITVEADSLEEAEELRKADPIPVSYPRPR